MARGARTPGLAGQRQPPPTCQGWELSFRRRAPGEARAATELPAPTAAPVERRRLRRRRRARERERRRFRRLPTPMAASAAWRKARPALAEEARAKRKR